MNHRFWKSYSVVQNICYDVESMLDIVPPAQFHPPHQENRSGRSGPVH